MIYSVIALSILHHTKTLHGKGATERVYRVPCGSPSSPGPLTPVKSAAPRRRPSGATPGRRPAGRRGELWPARGPRARLPAGGRGEPERVAVRVAKPGDSVAAGRGPDAQVVLCHAVVAGELNAPAGQVTDRGPDIGHLPPGDGERTGG